MRCIGLKLVLNSLFDTIGSLVSMLIQEHLDALMLQAIFKVIDYEALYSTTHLFKLPKETLLSRFCNLSDCRASARVLL
jgi:hypothetical protein